LYIVTFYSFKGGVGRTMALVNVGAELARTGARVLLVDFDLEAPSLMNFNLAGTTRPTLGVVDYVLSYQQSGQVPPDVGPYLCESESFAEGGRLAVMPAGGRGSDYASNLLSINWQRLYKEQSGFLLFEELKAQWAERWQPDYVLIDSRTGHNEVMGITTRQLPDAVCAVFLPNQQNLDGLADVVTSVRTQKTNSEGREIKLHFVVSNIPYADDERGTLGLSLNRYRERLGIGKFDVSLHHYPTLALLGQDVVVLNSPKLALAQEYRDLSDKIRAKNLQDRSSALKFLKGMHSSLRSSPDEDSNVEPSRLDDIAREHNSDADVLYWLARVRRQLGEVEQASLLLDRSIAQDPTRTQAYIDRASLRLRELDDNRLSQSREDFKTALEYASLGTPVAREVGFVIRSLVTLGGVDWKSLAAKPAVRKLGAEDQISLVWGLDHSDDACLASYEILSPLSTLMTLTRPEETLRRNHLSLCCIRLRKFDEAIALLCEQDTDPTTLEIADIFNLAMARWGADGHPSPDLFATVLSKATPENERSDNANYFQCLAIAAWKCNRDEDAVAFLARARAHIRTQPTLSFSAWRYLRINPIDFDADLDEIAMALRDHSSMNPQFIRVET
jgi:cellulose biosynthesis protein BcsQ